MKRKIAGIMAAFFLVLSLSGCQGVSAGFKDYDVSGYIRDLLKSSYLQQNDNETASQENNNTTVENGAVFFCNAYGLIPTDQQMIEIQDFIREAYLLAKFSVKEKQPTDDGFTVDVVVEPLTIFQNCTAEFEQALNDIKNGTLNISGNSNTQSSDNSEALAENEGENSDNEENNSSSGGIASGEAKLDEHALFVDEVIRLCKEKVSGNPTYGSAVTISMTILQSEEGDLSLDTRQLEEIDNTVLLLPGNLYAD